jgi:uncharacterized membrane protein
MTKKDGTQILCALLAYFFPIGLIWYLVDKKMNKDKFVAYHIYQSLAAAIIVLASNVLIPILMATVIGIIVAIPLAFAVSILSVVWFIQGLVYSLTSQQKPLLFLEKLAKKFSF